jgi:hypothetical protein
VAGESWFEAAFRLNKMECVKYLHDIGFRLVKVKNGRENKMADACLEGTLLDALGEFHDQGDNVKNNITN